MRQMVIVAWRITAGHEAMPAGCDWIRAANRMSITPDSSAFRNCAYRATSVPASFSPREMHK
jgi:hypothetical protein